MADVLDIAKAGQVTQDAGTQGNTGMQQGLNLAQAYQSHQAQLESHQAAMQDHTEKQNEFAFQQVNRAASIMNPAARKMALDQAKRQLEVAKVPFDPASIDLLKDDEYRNNYNQAAAQINGLNTTDERAAALQDHAQMLNDVGAADKMLATGGKTTAERYATNTSAQIANVGNQREMAHNAQQMASADFEKVSAQNKDANEALRSANTLQTILKDPKAGPMAIANAKGLMDKIVNQGAVLRPGTMTMLSEADRGVFERAKAIASTLSGSGHITPAQRKEILSVAQIAATPIALDLKQGKLDYMNAHPGMSQAQYDYVHSKTPQYDMPGVPAQVAGGAQAPAAQSSAQAAPAAKDHFAAVAPDAQAIMIKRAAQLGIKLDPKSPDFSSALASFQQQLLHGLSSGGAPTQTAQNPKPPQGAGQ